MDLWMKMVLCKLKADTVISIQSDRNCQNKRFQKVCFRKLEQTFFPLRKTRENKSSAHQRVRIFASQKQGGFMDILKACGLRKIYGSGETAVHALDGVNLTVEKGEFVAIVGTSGSGKSTLLHMLGGLDRPTEGKVFVDGKDIFALKDEELTIFRRRKIGFVFQAYNLVPVLNVYENIVLPIELDGGKIDRKFIDSITETLGLQQRLDALPGQLSGGQQQRVAIARALAAAPAIILADEPTGNLDGKTSQDVLSLLKVTSRKFAQTIVMITHNEEIAQLADRIIRIEDGRIIK